ncbi:tetratricopeptide repeat protein [Luteimonas sp. e5]
MSVLRMPSRVLVLMLGLLPVFAAAQSLPRPAEFYFDEDRGVTRAIQAERGEGDALVNRLLRRVERDPRAWDAMAQLGSLALAGGRPEVGKSLYQRAITGMGERHSLSRAVRWNYGWDLYRSGEPEAALAQWASLVETGSVRGEWMPPTLALVLWRLQRHDEARQWYAAAVRTHPERWSSPTDLSALLPEWTTAEREALLEVQRAWAENPPDWP